MMKAEKIVLGDSDDMERLLDKQKVIAYCFLAVMLRIYSVE